jgi:hypothetical protein
MPDKLDMDVTWTFFLFFLALTMVIGASMSMGYSIWGRMTYRAANRLLSAFNNQVDIEMQRPRPRELKNILFSPKDQMLLATANFIVCSSTLNRERVGLPKNPASC